MTEATPEQDPHAKTAVEQGSEIPLGWKPTPREPMPVVRCVQQKKDGTRCKRWSIRGYHKCARHAGPGAMEGGNVAKYAASVVEAARLRLVDNADFSIDVLESLMQPGSSEGIRLKAATEILDRAGIRGGFEVKVEAEVTVNPSDEINKRLAKLREGAEAVERMKQKSLEGPADDDGDVIDGEIIEEDDGQGALFKNEQ